VVGWSWNEGVEVTVPERLDGDRGTKKKTSTKAAISKTPIVPVTWAGVKPLFLCPDKIQRLGWRTLAIKRLETSSGRGLAIALGLGVFDPTSGYQIEK
jgi:hypothetical protein